MDDRIILKRRLRNKEVVDRIELTQCSNLRQ